MTPGDQLIGLLVAAMQDAAIEQKVTFIQATIDPGNGNPVTVRLVALPEEPVILSQEQMQSEINRVQVEGDGFHYSSDGLRIVVMRERGTHTFPFYAPLGTPPTAPYN